ncbi:MAG: hypothetical protein AB7Q97_22780 [Gammaproteobacteria bacterium]
MKSLTSAILGISLVVSMAPSADDSHHPEQTQGKEATPAASPQSGPASSDPMQERMKKMQDLMGRIEKTADPAARQKLMQEHLQQMHDGMAMMRGAGGGMGMGMMDGRGAQKAKQLDGRGGCLGTGENGMPESRMNMMQMMMDQMMKHQQAMQGAAK